MNRATFYTKLDAFVARLHEEMERRIIEKYPTLHEGALQKGRRGHHDIGYDEGKRFVRVVDRGESQTFVRYFVEKDTGTIFGASSWKKYNPNREYGTLDTIDDWDWSGYYATHKNGKSSLVPAHLRR